MNKVEELVNKWKENISNGNENYTEQQINGIAINCMSLAKTWFDNNQPKEKESYEVRLFNNDGVLSETLHGVTQENLPETIMSIITKNSEKYSMLTLNSFEFVNGIKNDIRELGKLDIFVKKG